MVCTWCWDSTLRLASINYLARPWRLYEIFPIFSFVGLRAVDTRPLGTKSFIVLLVGSMERL